MKIKNILYTGSRTGECILSEELKYRERPKMGYVKRGNILPAKNYKVLRVSVYSQIFFRIK